MERRDDEKSSTISLHAHGDGTYHTMGGGQYGDGKRTEHASIGHALMHIAKQHSEGDHMHVHSTDSGVSTHHVMEGGKVQGPHDHENLRSLKQSLSKFIDEEGKE